MPLHQVTRLNRQVSGRALTRNRNGVWRIAADQWSTLASHLETAGSSSDNILIIRCHEVAKGRHTQRGGSGRFGARRDSAKRPCLCKHESTENSDYRGNHFQSNTSLG